MKNFKFSNKFNFLHLFTKPKKSFFCYLATSFFLYYNRNELKQLTENFFNKESNNLQCFSTKETEITNTYYPANNPIEDRYTIKFLDKIKNCLFLSVLDGHGGYYMSEFANQRLYVYFEEEMLKQNSGSDNEKVVKSLKEAFNRVEMEFKELALRTYKKGQGRASTVGSCALVVVIYNDILYVANLGDSKASLIRYDENNKEYYYEKLMNRHNSEKPREKEKLYKMFPNEKDIVVCKRPNGTVCYVKGRLQPTRSFGDFHLKYAEFNENEGSEYKRPIKNFNGPYISAYPEFTIYPLNYSNDKYLVIATDGLGDFVSNQELVKIVSQKAKQNDEPKAEDLLSKVLDLAAEEQGMTRLQLSKVPLGKRRNLHDDTTIIFLPLKK